MFSKLEWMKISSRLFFGFGSLMLLLTMISAMSIYSGTNAKHAVTDVARLSGDETLAQRIEKRVFEGRMHIWMALATGDPSQWDKADDAFKIARDWFGELTSKTRDPKRLDDLKAFQSSVDAYVAAAGRLKSIGGSNGAMATPDAKALTSAAMSAGSAVTDVGESLSKQYEQASVAQVKSATEETGLLMTATSVLALISLGAGALLAWAVARSINRPIGALTTAMQALAAGNLSVEVPTVEGDNEISAMSRTVRVFKENAVEKIAVERKAAEQAAAAEVARREAEAEVLRKERQAVVASLGEALSALAQGDLTYSMRDDLAGEYAQLREDFNKAVDQLADVVGQISATAAAIQSGAAEINTASEDLSKRTENQAASLEETAAALDEITATVRRSAEGAKLATDAASGAREEAAKSSAIMNDAVTAMGEIEQSSTKITQIIAVIDEMAFQTNLLALNAGVEAARAGDAGRGFAVVAQEVRALAQRSAEAAREIKTLIAVSTEQVQRGVKLVGETGQALGGIVGKVRDINGLISQMATSSQEQATGLGQVNTAVNQMDQVTQQNAAMVEEASAAAASLRTEADRMAALMEQFQIRGKGPGPAAERHNPVGRTHAKLAAVLKSGGARPAPRDWEDF